MQKDENVHPGEADQSKTEREETNQLNGLKQKKNNKDNYFLKREVVNGAKEGLSKFKSKALGGGYMETG